jgi:hypothetical protein
MSLEINSENRNSNRINGNRCCSFCRTPGHNITRCNSEQIHVFERNLFIFIQILVSERQNNILIMENLRQYLLNRALHNPRLVRAFAISRCGARSTSNMDHCIILIIQFIQPFIIELIHHTEINNESSIQPETLSEELQLVHHLQERWRQIDFSELGIREIIENETNLYAIMFADIIRFIDIIRRMSETSELNRKFQIKTKISDNIENLEEKCECNICYEERENKLFVKLDCGHEFCKDCIRKSLQNEQRENPCCAFCRSDIKSFELKSETIKDEFNDLIIT